MILGSGCKNNELDCSYFIIVKTPILASIYVSPKSIMSLPVTSTK
jgi:hypothetical protein